VPKEDSGEFRRLMFVASVGIPVNWRSPESDTESDMTDSFPETDLTVTDDQGEAATDDQGEAAVVIAYDIQDDERRDEIRSICGSYGRWVQRSQVCRDRRGIRSFARSC